ncbi:hypothetical protein GCK72_023320 [Caenorhabditis remanei]|uniref:Uncharacterized protein n=1 Tax=Caenorhabditis remanei TaxID=31234 RepID=A0A6A5FWH1_CAERE|nr:hypothetical protein GCK72_023320 [Caenorhabditis remanei]KAF1746862.1 hypothetical protein GCK72_023320 [Caenorhabditis remanei]
MESLKALTVSSWAAYIPSAAMTSSIGRFCSLARSVVLAVGINESSTEDDVLWKQLVDTITAWVEEYFVGTQDIRLGDTLDAGAWADAGVDASVLGETIFFSKTSSTTSGVTSLTGSAAGGRVYCWHSGQSKWAVGDTLDAGAWAGAEEAAPVLGETTFFSKTSSTTSGVVSLTGSAAVAWASLSLFFLFLFFLFLFFLFPAFCNHGLAQQSLVPRCAPQPTLPTSEKQKFETATLKFLFYLWLSCDKVQEIHVIISKRLSNTEFGLGVERCGEPWVGVVKLCSDDGASMIWS